MKNVVFLIGHLGKDAEMKKLPSGNVYSRTSIATSEKYKDADGNKKEKTTWHNIILWGKMAEALTPYLKKGKMVSIEGKIDNTSWEDNGVYKNFSEIVVRELLLLDKAVDSKPVPTEPIPVGSKTTTKDAKENEGSGSPDPSEIPPVDPTDDLPF